jgi:hypothetical protein
MQLLHLQLTANLRNTTQHSTAEARMQCDGLWKWLLGYTALMLPPQTIEQVTEAY